MLFSDRGLSAGAISSLFIIWSTTTFLFEVPSGAWADVVDRRLLLVLSACIYGAGFASWVIWPTYVGFAFGFVCWGVSSALMSGTFEAFLYDELVAQSAEASYARLLGWAHAAAKAATMVGIAAGGPLFAWGGYPLVGWVSVAVVVVHGALALTLPSAPRAESADETADVAVSIGGTNGASLARRYVAMLRAGVHEAARHVDVRHAVLIAAVLMGVSAYDEYFGLLAREQGADTGDVPILMAIVTAGQVLGTALAGRTESMSRRTMAAMVLVAGAAIAAGALSGHPIGIVGITIGYGMAHNAIVVSEARLQTVITGPARATVTSTMGFGAEVFAVGCYASFGIGSPWLAVGTLVALLGLPLLGIAAAIRAWWD